MDLFKTVQKGMKRDAAAQQVTMTGLVDALKTQSTAQAAAAAVDLEREREARAEEKFDREQKRNQDNERREQEKHDREHARVLLRKMKSAALQDACCDPNAAHLYALGPLGTGVRTCCTSRCRQRAPR